MWQFRVFLLLMSTWGISSIPAHPGASGQTCQQLPGRDAARQPGTGVYGGDL
uniref:Protein C n=1 Tax=Mus musculus TaxID=10090 RepID=A0A3Q4EGJ8_MOUSE